MSGTSTGYLGSLFRGDIVKRAVDVSVALVMLVVLAPLIAAIAIGVRVRLGSPILFRQERPGRCGVPFELIKFRTMADGAGTDAERLDAFGRFLRSTSLDELPELVNVLRGEMSLVGPRPLLTEYLPLYNERQSRRHEIRPGLTGLAQVSGRNDLAWPERLELDVVYVETRSMALDLRIIVQTIWSVLARRGISAEGEATMAKFTGGSDAA